MKKISTLIKVLALTLLCMQVLAGNLATNPFEEDQKDGAEQLAAQSATSVQYPYRLYYVNAKVQIANDRLYYISYSLNLYDLSGTENCGEKQKCYLAEGVGYRISPKEEA